MIMAVSNDVEDLLALTGHAQAAGGKLMRQTFMFLYWHPKSDSGLWNNNVELRKAQDLRQGCPRLTIPQRKPRG
jgi:hypothetical protein